MFIGKHSIIKLSVLPQISCVFNEILIKFPSVFMYLEKLISNCVWKCKRTKMTERLKQREGGDTWRAHSVKHLSLAQVMILGSWNGASPSPSAHPPTRVLCLFLKKKRKKKKRKRWENLFYQKSRTFRKITIIKVVWHSAGIDKQERNK